MVSFTQYALQPVINGLKNAELFIKKGEAHAKAQGHDANDYLTASIHPEMHNFIRQVQMFTDAAKFLAMRVNPENPTFTLVDEEKTFPELIDRIQRTIKYLESIDEKNFDGKEDSEVKIQYKKANKQVRYSATDYVMEMAHPNFWFHVVTAYNILRMKGVDVGKLDYLNGNGKKAFEPMD